MKAMTKTINSLTLVTTLVLALALGCATGTKGLSDAEQIAALLGTWEQGILDQDVDKLMTLYSEDFSHDGYDYDAAGKEELREFVEYSIDEGNFDDVEISFDSADTEIEGNTAVVYPIDYATTAGAITIELELTKEKAGWLITDMAIEGL